MKDDIVACEGESYASITPEEREYKNILRD